MLSRSSSAYQPLDSAAAGGPSREDDIESAGKPTPKTTARGGGASKIMGTGGGVEMTSIAVVSNHPFRPGGGGATTTTKGSKACADLDFKVCKSEPRTQWTNFHFVMCIGVGGFFIFWFLLLSRMYLPPEFQLWGGGGAARSTTPPPPPPAEEDLAHTNFTDETVER